MSSHQNLIFLQGLVLKGFDEEGRKFIQDIYEQVGITLHLGESPVKMEKNSSGKITVHSETKDKKEQTLPDVDVVLFATGRKPNTKELGLEDVGVTLGEKGELKVSVGISYIICQISSNSSHLLTFICCLYDKIRQSPLKPTVANWS